MAVTDSQQRPCAAQVMHAKDLHLQSGLDQDQLLLLLVRHPDRVVHFDPFHHFAAAEPFADETADCFDRESWSGVWQRRRQHGQNEGLQSAGFTDVGEGDVRHAAAAESQVLQRLFRVGNHVHDVVVAHHSQFELFVLCLPDGQAKGIESAFVRVRCFCFSRDQDERRAVAENAVQTVSRIRVRREERDEAAAAVSDEDLHSGWDQVPVKVRVHGVAANGAQVVRMLHQPVRGPGVQHLAAHVTQSRHVSDGQDVTAAASH